MKAITLEEHVLGLICNVFDAYSAVLFLPDEKGINYNLASFWSLGENIAADASVQPGKGLVGWIIENHKPLLVSNFDHRENLEYYDSDSEEGIKSFMGAPVPTGGALCVDSKRQYSFSEKDQKILQMFTELISEQQRLGQNDLAEDIPRYFAELAVIHELRFKYRRWPAFLQNFLHTIREATEFDYCAFATQPENAQYYCLECESSPLLLTTEKILRLPADSGLVGWVFRNEQPVYAEGSGTAHSSALFGRIEDMPEFSTAICLPVMIHKSCRGVLCLANKKPRTADESLRSFIRQAVDHLGLFLENLYLTSRLRQLLPQARLEREGGRVYNPDTAPMPQAAPSKENDDRE